ncbi:hypothetical protein BJV74DRAFT_890397 [Russula compacta]|nr:hypothetical protein BJV74DRAFT_890397 [Russula compacta]
MSVSVEMPPPLPPKPATSPESLTTPRGVSRTASSVSSLRYSVFDSSSLVDYSLEEPFTEPSLLTTEPSLLSTEPSLQYTALSAESTHHMITPSMIPLLSSPPLTTPSASISVSISTPHSDIPSMRSDLDSHRSEVISHDINRLLQHLHDLDQTRGLENRDLADNMHVIRDELRDLSDFLEAANQNNHLRLCRKKIGRSSGGSIGHRDMAIADEPILLTPPPVRVPSPSSIPSSISFMSSHHSDDYSLMESESYPLGPASPPWSSSSSSSPPGSEHWSTPMLPPRSATPSSSSDITVRPSDELSTLRERWTHKRSRRRIMGNPRITVCKLNVTVIAVLFYKLAVTLNTILVGISDS